MTVSCTGRCEIKMQDSGVRGVGGGCRGWEGEGGESEDALHLLQQSSTALDREPTAVLEYRPTKQASKLSNQLTSQPTNPQLAPYSNPSSKTNSSRLVKNFSAFYPKVHCLFHKNQALSLSSARSIQSTTATDLRFMLILSSHLRRGLPSSPFTLGFPPKPCMQLSWHPYVPHAPPISFMM
jgi:hypothetical protein